MRKGILIVLVILLAVTCISVAGVVVIVDKYKQLELQTGRMNKENSYLKSTAKIYIDMFSTSVSDKEYSSPIAVDDFIQYTSPFGDRYNPLKRNTGGAVGFHNGVDIKGSYEARVIAIGDGVVIDKWNPKGWLYGRYFKGHPLFDGYIRVRHSNGDISGYGHLGIIYIREGVKVKAGQIIGRIGESRNGLTTGPHLHFSLQTPEGEFVQPFKYVDMP